MNKSVIDLFCGCGGFSLAAHQAGFNVTTSVDIDPILTSSYKMNFPISNLLLSDIAKLSGVDLIKYNGGVPTGIIGGPPCQGFSLIGKRDKFDERNELLYHFFRIVSEVKPAFFIMENVPGLLAPGSINVLSEAINNVANDYTIIFPQVYDASKFGAATKRKRVIVIGYNPAYCDTPKPPSVSKEVSVKEAISDLPIESNKKILENEFVFRKLRLAKSLYAKNMRRLPPQHLGSSLFKEMLKRELISGCVFTKHSENVSKRFLSLKQGETDKISRYMKLKWDKPCNTLRAGTGKDKGAFQAARPIHPKKSRVINVREAARLQGFPDWFAFHSTTWHSFRMIGNSVAPIMGEAILKTMYASLNKQNIQVAE